MSVHSVWHVGFSVADLERSISFYRNALGLELKHRQTGDNPYTRTLVGYDDAVIHVAQFTIPGAVPPSGHVLELIEYEVPRGESIAPSNARIGSGHLAFEVDDIQATAARVVESGGSLVSNPVAITAGINAGGWAVYFRDPDGITLELIQPASRTPEKAVDDD
ncbi:MAG: Glyoxalase/bleomycin resistance protein/dioxygenase [Rhodoglobus sp.]|nr:Glyoxalase/bleomycin resistance protein/dioxygenase [Rhodoglobus sp.]